MKNTFEKKDTSVHKKNTYETTKNTSEKHVGKTLPKNTSDIKKTRMKTLMKKHF